MVLTLSAVGVRTADAMFIADGGRLVPGHRLPILQGIKAPVPSVVPSAPPTAGCLSATQVASYATGAGFPTSVVPTMVQIAYRESHWCSGAVNASSGAVGLWQIYPSIPNGTDPAVNAAAAYAKYEASGLSPWGM